ncbi:MAG: SHOCT domain-containing protein [Desulfohalobiaceae bacterium]
MPGLHLMTQGRMADGWSTWPFGPGFEHSWISAVLRFAFIGLILGGILALLRWAFGPGGWLRDKELEAESEAERKSKQEAVDVLRKRLAAGEIDADEFEKRKRSIER